MNLESYKIEDATHYLKCARCIGRGRVEYLMECTFVKKMYGGRSKVVVFGERNWADRSHIKNIRYVSNLMLTKITKENRRELMKYEYCEKCQLRTRHKKGECFECLKERKKKFTPSKRDSWVDG